MEMAKEFRRFKFHGFTNHNDEIQRRMDNRFEKIFTEISVVPGATINVIILHVLVIRCSEHLFFVCY